MKFMTQIDLKKLRSMLPTGYSKELQKIIKKKHKKTLAAQTIRRGLTEKFASQIVIDAAFEFITRTEESNAKNAELLSKV